MFRLSPRRWQRSDKSGMTELETGAWISASKKSAEVRKEFKKRTSTRGLLH